MPDDDEERIALFLDYENLAFGAREQLHQASFDFGPVADALAERGRVVVRRAYADWSSFGDERRELTRFHVELIEIPQRMGAVRKNAADIKMAVDAIELCFERDYITTYVLGTGDSDFTPLVHKLRELNRRVIGIGVEAATSALLPPACDEFLFYERLEGVDLSRTKKRTARGGRTRSSAAKPVPADGAAAEAVAPDDTVAPARGDEADLDRLITGTLAGLERRAGGAVLASQLKRAVLRKDPTFSETTYGFRGFAEMLTHLERRGYVELAPGSAQGDPIVSLRTGGSEEEAFTLLRGVVERLGSKSAPVQLSGLKDQVRKVASDFSEKRFGYGGFLQFAKAAQRRGVVEMEWSDDLDDYVITPPAADSGANSAAGA